jgi:hypothetical protein
LSPEFASLQIVEDNLALPEHPSEFMAAPLSLFRLLNEFVIFLLGALLVVLALSRSLHPADKPVVWLLLGVLLIYWGARTGMRASPQATRWYDRLRAASLICAGLLVMSLARVPLRYAPLLLAIAGAILALRGLVGAAGSLRR